MTDWNRIQESHVIKLTREICYKWWGVDIQVYDEYSNGKNNNVPFQNPLCRLINSTPDGAQLCSVNYKKHLKEFNTSNKPFLYECPVGLQGAIAPIITKGGYIGAIIGSGIQSLKISIPMQREYIKRLRTLGFDAGEVEECYKRLQQSPEHSREYLLDFIEMVAKDIIAFYEMLQEKEEVIRKQASVLEKLYNKKYTNIIGRSPAIKKIFDMLELIENFDSPVLIEGESGTGKELLAASIHYNSSRKDKMFVLQNCSAFSDTLLNSELFGHEKGSFTGAISEKKGLFEIADNGTLFLDEIGDMDKEVQAKLLRVLEDGTFYRVGGVEPKKVDVRIIAATNKKLLKQIEQGLFRKDLFYRINTISITMPPLRERREDIVSLVDYFLKSYLKTHHNEEKKISPEVMKFLTAYDWPGNIRELRNLVERLIVFSGKEKIIQLHHLPEEIMAAYQVPEIHKNSNKKLKDALKSLEKEIVKQALKRAKWNKTAASRELSISRASLNNKITQFNIQQN